MEQMLYYKRKEMNNMKMIFTESELITLHELVNRKIDTECKTITENNIDNYVGLVALKAKLNALYKMSNPSVLTVKDNINIPNGTVTLPYKPENIHSQMYRDVASTPITDAAKDYLKAVTNEQNKKLESEILGTNDGVLNHVVPSDSDELTTSHTDESKIKEVIRVRN